MNDRMPAGTSANTDDFEWDMLRDTARGIASSCLQPRASGGANKLDHACWTRLAEAGLLGVRLDESFGGSGLNHTALRTIAVELGRLAPALPYLGTVVLFAELVRRIGRADQQAAWLPGLTAGSLRGALACYEAAGQQDMQMPDTRLTSRPDGLLSVTGSKTLVLGGAGADVFLVTVRDASGSLMIIAVPADTPGVERTDFTTYDGMMTSDVTLTDVVVPASAVLGSNEDAGRTLAAVIDTATAILCAEAAAICQILCDSTIAYCKLRVAFGKPLIEQQVVRHRLVDMLVAREHLAALADAANATADDQADPSPRAISAAKVLACRDGRAIAQAAVQLHGAIGLTEELEVGRLFQRITAIAMLFGSQDQRLRNYSATSGEVAEADTVSSVLGLLSADEKAFRAEVQSFYERELDDTLRLAGQLVRWAFSEFEAGVRWQRILHKRGWGAPDWPGEHGGVGWTPRQQIIFALETMQAEPPAIMNMGRDLCAPCIMAFGTEQQKAEFLPRILDGTDWWAQGYSEPQAGSDLASLQMAAVSDGDDYVLNGSKIWTTYAHHANRIFCLVRTAKMEKKQQGITFLLIDMDTPGIEVRPIVNIAGDHEFNEVFFTNVRVPKSRRLGAENDGWSVARFLLKHEHGGRIAGVMRLRDWLAQISRRSVGMNADQLADFAQRLAEISIDLDAAIAIAIRETIAAQQGATPSSYAEMVNIRQRDIQQRLTELAIECRGPAGLTHRRDLLSVATAGAASQDEIWDASALPLYFSHRAATIAGGTPEMHRNNVARSL